MTTFALVSAVLSLAAPPASQSFEPHVFSVGRDSQNAPTTYAHEIQNPWSFLPSPHAGGFDSIVRHFSGQHYVVCSDSDTVRVVDASTLLETHSFGTGAGLLARDICVVAPDRAYVSRYGATHLYRVNPQTGVGFDAVDLSVLADADGVPEMVMMERVGNRLFVQLQRLDENFAAVPPSLLAVVDLRTDTLIDVDPVKPGVQGIELVGTYPAYKMQVERAERRLYVSTPGPLLRGGGIEEIDLDTLQSNGWIATELVIGGDMTGFVLVSPELGYVLTHTDLTLSSHLTAFSRIDGSHQGEKFVTFTQVDSLAFDAKTGQLFFPDGNAGIRVFDAATGVQLSSTPVGAGDIFPTDVIVARPRLVKTPLRPQ